MTIMSESMKHADQPDQQAQTQTRDQRSRIRLTEKVKAAG